MSSITYKSGQREGKKYFSIKVLANVRGILDSETQFAATNVTKEWILSKMISDH